MPLAVSDPSSLPVASPSLELGLIGNCTFNALVDGAGAVVWCCMPRPDSDPVLHALLGTTGAGANGRFTVEIADAEPDRLQVGARVRFSFRRLFTTGGIHDYFWKAVLI